MRSLGFYDKCAKSGLVLEKKKEIDIEKTPLWRYGLVSSFEQMILLRSESKDTTDELRGKGPKSRGVEAC